MRIVIMVVVVSVWKIDGTFFVRTTEFLLFCDGIKALHGKEPVDLQAAAAVFLFPFFAFPFQIFRLVPETNRLRLLPYI